MFVSLHFQRGSHLKTKRKEAGEGVGARALIAMNVHVESESWLLGVYNLWMSSPQAESSFECALCCHGCDFDSQMAVPVKERDESALGNGALERLIRRVRTGSRSARK